jgi:hypothetical protein
MRKFAQLRNVCHVCLKLSLRHLFISDILFIKLDHTVSASVENVEDRKTCSRNCMDQRSRQNFQYSTEIMIP